MNGALGTSDIDASADHIRYQEGRSVSRDRDDATNDMLSVANDGHQLGLESGYGFGGFVGGPGPGNEERFFSAERAAQLLWQRFIENLSVESKFLLQRLKSAANPLTINVNAILSPPHPHFRNGCALAGSVVPWCCAMWRNKPASISRS